jgi:hypothetical protein
MKSNKLIFGAFLLAGVLTFQACSKIEKFGNINSNPNATTEPNTGALLTNALSGLGNTVWGNGITINGGLYCQYFSETQYTEASRYATINADWDGYYAGAMYDLQNIINYNLSNPGAASANGNNENQIAIARILKAYFYWILTDSYGDLPYFNALKGDGNTVYDPQEQIYPDLIKEISEAVDQFVTPTINIRGDILMGGNIDKWKKFGNSLRLLMALQLTKKFPAAGGYAANQFNAALNHPAGVIESNSDNATLNFPGGVFNHPLYSYYNITLRFDYAMSETMANFLNPNNDARRNVYGSSTKGFPYGLTRDNALSWTSANPDWAMILHGSVRQPNSPVVIIGAANVYLARAEAAQRGWTSESASAMYSLGIQRSWEQWGVYNATAFANYMASPSISLGTGNALTKINTQQWVAFYPYGTRGWSNWRRTGVPTLTQPPGVSLPVPRRFPYGPRESQTNLANYLQAAGRYTVAGVPNSQDGRMWWDQ